MQPTGGSRAALAGVAGVRGQRGVAAVVVAGVLVALIALVGLVIDAGYAYLTHSRLQTAADACALAGVKQVDDTKAGLKRAEAAGASTARANLQAGLSAAEYADIDVVVGFNDRLTTDFDSAASAPKASNHVRCTVTGAKTWFSGLMALANYSLSAQATAKMETAAAVCAIPLAVCAKEIATTTSTTNSCTCPSNFSNVTDPGKKNEKTWNASTCNSTSKTCSQMNAACAAADAEGDTCTSTTASSSTSYTLDMTNHPERPWGLYRGQWVTRPRDSSVQGPYTSGVSGSFNWANISGVGGASALKDALAGPGFCDIDPTSATANIDTEIGNPGVISSMSSAWNTRLGLYKSQVCNTADSKRNQGKVLGEEPDFTGHPFDPATYGYVDSATGVRNVYGRTTNCPTDGSPCNYKEAKETNTAYPGASNQCFFDSSELKVFGKDRRLVALPVVQCSKWSGGGSQQAPIKGWMCGLIVREFPSSGSAQVEIEVIGPVNEPGSPCGQVGVAAKNSIAGKVATLVE